MKNRKITIVVFAAICTTVSTAAAADPLYKACIDRATDNVSYSECGDAYLKRADKALNIAWQRTFAVTDGQTKTDLLKEQRAWLAFKEVSCTFYANGDRGREGAVISFPACRGQVIEQRTTALAAIGQDLAPH